MIHSTMFDKHSLLPQTPQTMCGDEEVMIWLCVAATGHGEFTVIMNSTLYHIFENIENKTVQQLKLDRNWVMQQPMIPSKPAIQHLNG